MATEMCPLDGDDDEHEPSKKPAIAAYPKLKEPVFFEERDKDENASNSDLSSSDHDTENVDDLSSQEAMKHRVSRSSYSFDESLEDADGSDYDDDDEYYDRLKMQRLLGDDGLETESTDDGSSELYDFATDSTDEDDLTFDSPLEGMASKTVGLISNLASKCGIQ